MNRVAMPRRLLVTLSLLLTVACQGGEAPPGPSPDGVDLRGAAVGGPFELVDKTGRSVRWGNFAGKYRIVYFGYTFCPDVCPTDVQRMVRGLNLFARDHPTLAKKIVPIFITVDPRRDTPAKVGEFAAAFSPDIVGLTGAPVEIERAKKAFGVFASKGEVQPGGGYLVNHTNVTYLFDPDGKPLGTLPTDKGPEAVAGELAGWVR